MDTFKFNAFVKEFPFLADCFEHNNGEMRDPKNCDGISIKRITAELLSTTPKTYSWDGSLVGIDEWNRVDFVLMDGTVIKDAVKTTGTSGSNYAYSETRNREGETVLEAIARHNAANTLAYVIFTSSGFNVVEHYSQSNWSATIYKPAKDLALQQAIEEANDRATAEVKAEANF